MSLDTSEHWRPEDQLPEALGAAVFGMMLFNRLSQYRDPDFFNPVEQEQLLEELAQSSGLPIELVTDHAPGIFELMQDLHQNAVGTLDT